MSVSTLAAVTDCDLKNSLWRMSSKTMHPSPILGLLRLSRQLVAKFLASLALQRDTRAALQLLDELVTTICDYSIGNDEYCW